MANVKPVSLSKSSNRNITKAEREEREKAEAALKGNEISKKVPDGLSTEGKKIYKRLLKSFPDKFLTDTDSFTLEIVANSLDMMYKAQSDINARGLLVDEQENPSIRTYERYSKLFNTFGAKLGMSPKDRASMSLLILQDKEKEEDPLLKALGAI